jgi:hypothetical protein
MLTFRTCGTCFVSSSGAHMTIIKRIAPASAFKVGLVVYGFLGLILGACCTVIAIVEIFFMREAHLPIFGRFVGLFAVIVCPILYGIIGGVGAAIAALIYNLAAGWVGGLEVNIT